MASKDGPNMKVNCVITVRIGSERLSHKNLRLLSGRPLASYSIEIAKRSGVFDRIVLDGDDPVFENIAREGKVEFYLRPKELGASSVLFDEVIYDFMEKHPSDVTAVVNAPSPLLDPEEVAQAVQLVTQDRFDTVIASQLFCRHTLLQGRPINFQTDTPFARTQDLTPVETLCYSFMIWRCSSFRASMRKQRSGIVSGRFGTFPVSPRGAIAIKTEEDLRMVQALIDAGETPSAGLYQAIGISTPSDVTLEPLARSL
jgi:CMP-N-acetylneuraminic acid synthetase